MDGQIYRETESYHTEWDYNLTLIEQKEILKNPKKQSSKTSDKCSLSIHNPLRDFNLIKNKNKGCFNFAYY